MTTATQTQIRRDTATNLNAATPAAGELGYDTTNKRLVAGDGATNGGIKIPSAIDVQGNTFICGDAGGTADALTVTLSPAPTAYASYQRFLFKATATNATTTPTVNFNSLGTKTIKKKSSTGLSALNAGDIQSGVIYTVTYDGTYMQLEAVDIQANTSAMVLLGTQTASASATLDFTSLISSTYKAYKFIISDLRPATDGVALWIRTSTNNGSSYDAGTGYNYAYNGIGLEGGSTITTNLTANVASAAAIVVCGASAGSVFMSIGNAAAEGISGEVSLINPIGTTRNKALRFEISGQNSTTLDWASTGYGVRTSTSDIDAVRFMLSSGNITSGSIKMYGIT